MVGGAIIEAIKDEPYVYGKHVVKGRDQEQFWNTIKLTRYNPN